MAYPLADWIALCLYIFASFFGAISNGFIIYTVYKRRMKTTTFTLVANQAFSDMSCGIIYLCLLFLCSSKALSYGTPGVAVCGTAILLHFTTFEVSGVTMAVISIERYLKLHNPSKCIQNPFRVIVGIWIFSFVTWVLSMFGVRCAEYFTENKLVGCRLLFDQLLGFEIFAFAYTLWFKMTVFFANTVLPVLITALMYYKIIRVFMDKNRIQQATSCRPSTKSKPGTEKKQDAFEKSRRQTTKMLIVIVVAYIILITPVYAIWYVNAYVTPILGPCDHTADAPLYYFVAFLGAFLTICVNPFIYCYYHEIFRAEAKAIFKRTLDLCGFRRSAPSAAVGTSSTRERF